MMGCYQIKRLIDEADRPDLLPFEAAGHIASCRECKSFADERVKLRELLTSTARVSVPVNFDAVLRQRLDEVRARRSFSWFSPAGYVRLGAATAALFVAVFLAQYANLFSVTNQTRPVDQDPGAELQQGPIAKTFAPPTNHPGNGDHAMPPGGGRPLTISPVRGTNVRQGRDRARDLVPIESDFPADGAVILVRGQGGEREIPIQTVSVGAQQLLYVNAGRQPARSVGTTF